MKSNNALIFLFFILTSILCFIGTAYIGSFSLATKLIIGSALYFFIVLILLKKFPIWHYWIFLIFSLPLILVLLFINVLNFNKGWISLPSNFFQLLGCLSGYYFYKKRNYLIPIILIVLIGCWQAIGSRLLVNKIYYDTIDQVVLFKAPVIRLFDSNQVQINLYKSDKVLILDFWNSHCGPCYRLFPTIDSVNKRLDKSKFDLRLVNIPMNGEVKEDNFRLLNKYNYTLNQLFSENSLILDTLGISVFPTTLIIKNNQVIFRGEFKNAVKKLKEL